MTSSLSSKLNLIVGLNPALQRIVHVPDLIVGDVNRGQKVDVGIGGKGQNVIVAANCMQTVSNYRPALLQLLGKGAEGDQVLELLRPLIDKKMEKLSVRPSIRCRTCITLVDPVKQETTEIIEPSDPMAIEEVEYMINTVTETFVVDKVGGIAIMGSMPPGCPPTTYRSVVSATCDVNSKVLIDTVVGTIDILQACVEIGCPTILKINAQEITKLAGMSNKAGSSSGTEPADVSILHTAIDSIKEILFANGSKDSPIYAAITDGPHPVTVISIRSGRTWQLKASKLTAPVVNPIGAGDAVASGTLHRWTEKVLLIEEKLSTEIDESVLQAIRWGVACGTASCLTDSNSIFSRSAANEIYSKIEVDNIQ